MKTKAAKYLSFVKFSHTIFAMPFALIGFFLAVKNIQKPIDWKILIFVILCMVFARNSAMGFNRYLDRNIDKLNPRTKSREIPSGIISANAALIFVIVNCIFFITTAFFINHLTFYLSPVALFVILVYSYTKRFTALCHFVLGLGLSLAPIGAYISVTGHFDFLPVLFSVIVLLWVSGFDIIYSLQDVEFDKSENLNSVPALIGKNKAVFLSVILHFFTAVIVLLAGYYANFGIVYWIGAAIFTGMLIYQHLLVKPHDLSKINIAFASVNGTASILFAAFTIAEILIFKSF